MTAILGVNAYHADSSACLLRDGILIAAVEEERFNRVKHWAGLPAESIQYCLREAGLSLKDISTIAINSNPRANFLRKAAYTITHRPGTRLLRDRLKSRAARRAIPERIADVLRDRGFDGDVQFVEHHLAHLASAYYTSPFDRALALSVDAFGDFASTAWGLGDGSKLDIDDKIYFPHSLGIFYEAITRFLGFQAYGDEYKIMGLAACGTDRYHKEMQRLVRLGARGRFSLSLKYFTHHQGREVITWDGCAPVTGDHFAPAFCELLGPPREPQAPIDQRHMDIACSTQRMYELALLNLVRHLNALHGVDSLVLSGGCAFNSVANGRIRTDTSVDSVFVQAAAGDAGGALGAALHSWYSQSGDKARIAMQHAYWGPGFSDEEISRQLHACRDEFQAREYGFAQMSSSELFHHVASAIADGQVVGWFQGRMEWGPRALGNRSILCDPRRADMKEILNGKVKCREPFRPFAPSILREAVSDWFEMDDDVPFMSKVLTIRPEKQEAIPAVIHVDGTGRLQTVERHQNPMFYSLIQKFNELTGVPILLNTSFNQHEPIVCTVAQAIDCFVRTRMDMLVLGHHVIARQEAISGETTELSSESGWDSCAV